MIFDTQLFVNNNTFYKSQKFFHVCLSFNSHSMLKNLDWVFIQKNISHYSQKYEVELQALVMMSTHVHLLIASYSKNENYFCEQLQKKLDPQSTNENLAEPILSYSQYLNTYRYIYRNPVDAHICFEVQQYPYSSLQLLMGKSTSYCLTVDQLGFIQNPLKILNWLNETHFKLTQRQY